MIVAAPALPRPGIHQLAALGEKIAAPVGGLGLVGDGMRQRGLGNLAGDLGKLRRPIAEGRAEPMRRQVDAPSGIGVSIAMFDSGLPALTLGKAKYPPLTSPTCRRTSSTRLDNGTRCSQWPSVRSAGTVQFRAAASISSVRVPSSSVSARRLAAGPVTAARERLLLWEVTECRSDGLFPGSPRR
jgi:hypothetical protein